MVRAKFKCNQIIVTDGVKYDEDSKAYPAKQASIVLNVVYEGSEENKKFFIATPCGEIRLDCMDQEAFKQFEEGREYYIDFTDATPKPTPE